LELVQFLLDSNQKGAARAELIAVAANLPPDVDLQTKVGSLLLEVAGYDDALRLFRQALAGVYSESSAPTSKCSRTRDLDAVGCLTYVFCLPRSSKPSVFANSC